MIDWNHLTAPFSPDDIEWKPGATTRDKKKGLAMGYITSRAVQERLDEVFTPGGWKNEFRAGPDGGVICRIYFKTGETVDVGGILQPEWAWREDGADNTDVEAVKGGLSNAMKRAGSALGIGRYLYRLPAQWVPLDERGRFAQTPRIPREYLPASGDGAGRPPEATPDYGAKLAELREWAAGARSTASVDMARDKVKAWPMPFLAQGREVLDAISPEAP